MLLILTASVYAGEDSPKPNESSEQDVLIRFDDVHVMSDDVRSQVADYTEEIDFYELIEMASARVQKDYLPILEELPGIKYIEEDYEVLVMNTELESEPIGNNQTIPWGVDRVFDDEYSFDVWEHTKGAVGVAVIDTGIDRSHDELEVVDGANFVDDSPWYEDNHGHGTQMAGSIAALDNDSGVVGIAPDAELYSIKGLGDSGSGNMSDVIDGIEWAVEQEIPIINMSLSIGNNNSEVLQDVVDEARDQGHLLVASAGNEGIEEVEYPAAYESVMAVSASNESDEKWENSSYGDEVEISAPGAEILTTTPMSYFGQDLAVVSGTSSAAAHVSGAAALLWGSDEELSNEELREVIRESAVDIGLESNEQGYGLVNVSQGVDLLNNREGENEEEEDEEKDYFDLDLQILSEDAGEVKGSGEYEDGEEVTIEATPADGKQFFRWIGADVEDPYDSSTNVILDDDKTITAVFIDSDFRSWGDSKTIEDPDKIWEIKFNQSLDPDSLEGDKTVYITDGSLETVSVSLELDEENKLLIEPEEEYKSDETYTLWINELESQAGTFLKEKIFLDFSLQE